MDGAKTAGVLWTVKFTNMTGLAVPVGLLTVPILTVTGLDGVRAEPGWTVPKLPEFSGLCNLSTCY